MNLKDKELMEAHLSAISKAIYSLNSDEDLQFSRELNLKLINRERANTHKVRCTGE